MNVLLYFPVWGHVLCCAMMLACHEWGAAWFAAAAAYFAFCWLSKKPKTAVIFGRPQGGRKMERMVGHSYPRWIQNSACWWIWRKLCCSCGWHLWDEVVTLDRHYLSCDACGAEAVLDNEWRDALLSRPYPCESVIAWCSLDNAPFDACEVYYADNGWNSVRDDCEVTAITHWRPMPIMSNNMLTVSGGRKETTP